MLKINLCILGLQSDTVGLIIDDPPLVFGGNYEQFPQSLLDKLKPQNNTGLGSTTVQGTVLNTQDATRTILNVVNTYLTDKLTADEMAWILSHRDKFTSVSAWATGGQIL